MWSCVTCSASNEAPALTCTRCGNHRSGTQDAALPNTSFHGALQPHDVSATRALLLEVVKAGDVAALSTLVATVSAFPLVQPWDKEGTALAVASRHNHLPMVWYLVRTIGMSLASKVNASNDTALHVASRAGHLELVGAIAPFVDVTATNFDGRTATAEACANDQVAIVEYLIDTFPSSHLDWMDLMYVAVNAQALQVLAWLLSRAPVQMRDSNSLWQRAIDLKDEKVCVLLLEHGLSLSGLDDDRLSFVRGLRRSSAVSSQPNPPVDTTNSPLFTVGERMQLASAAPQPPSTNSNSPPRTTAISPLPPLRQSQSSTAQQKDQYAIGQHTDWGTVLKQHVARADMDAAKNFHKDLLRLQRSNGSRTHALVRYVGTDASDATLLFEPPGIPLSRAQDSPVPDLFAKCTGKSWSEGKYLYDIAQAVAYLHENGRPHGAICPANCFVDPKSGSGKLLVVFQGSTPTALTAPEAQHGSTVDPFAADVYSLGRVLMSQPGLTQEALDLANWMTTPQPTHRPKMADVVAHPVWWTLKTKLQYIQAIASYSADHPRVARCKNLRCPNWQTKLPPVVLAGTNQHRTYNHTVYALVRYIRNFKEHGRDHSPDMWQALHDALGAATPVADVSDLEFQEQCLGGFVAQAFPTLVLDLWRALGNLDAPA
ncbi:hypothetical protein H310_14700 [Aphanomyces invadans]|uniref:RanBP2-type domain-containing protein n=1 Tax=Aphanomyces invadans TaxID=157072 RepID=A0A024T8P4_9STRA|nr:hypothetical protein H310_14700 [Aphanomyces invadans]ETV90510.1 hypothetical protein H310_14700 [Aphanomyces invadans]|eukprot:XP_008880826.1 hypothetical protein H310_14700 [Aphanomyces invadans]